MAKLLALVSFKILPAQMGGQKGVAYFYKHLFAFHDVTIAASGNNSVDDAVGLKLKPWLFQNRRIYLNLLSLYRLNRLIKNERIECIIAEHSYTAWLAFFLKRKNNIPFIIHSHNIEALRFRQMKRWGWKLYLSVEKWMHQKADHNFFISESDRERAISLFNLQRTKCSVATYGTESPTLIENAGNLLRAHLGLSCEKIFYFNGSLDYYPNKEAMKNLVQYVLPLLTQKMDEFVLVVTGKNASPKVVRLLNHKKILYKGFTPDLNLFYQGCDVFLNPVINDAGVKTKLIEALCNGCKVVSTTSGAVGVEKELAGSNLMIIPDGDWNSFSEAAVHAVAKEKHRPSAEFLAYYSWKTIAEKTAAKIDAVIANYE